MRSVRYAWGEVFAQWAGIICVVSALIGIYPTWGRVSVWLSDNNAAAWVQAVGSIFAIIGSVCIALWQSYKIAVAKEDDDLRKEIHYCEICLQMCQAAVSVVRSAGEVELELSELLSKENHDEKSFDVYWKKYTSVDRVDNIQRSIIALLEKEMSGELMKSLFSIQKYLAIYREAMYLAKEDWAFHKELKTFEQGDNLVKEVTRIKHQIVDYKKTLNRG